MLKGDKYKLEIAGQEIICNGNTLWTFIKDAEEVQVNEPEYEEGSINPANIFTVYENGFKSFLIKNELMFNNKDETIPTSLTCKSTRFTGILYILRKVDECV